jgi:hypothetical protein
LLQSRGLLAKLAGDARAHVRCAQTLEHAGEFCQLPHQDLLILGQLGPFFECSPAMLEERRL